MSTQQDKVKSSGASFKWSRAPKATGLASVAANNEGRSWILSYKGISVASISFHDSLSDNVWRVSLYQSRDGNVLFKKTFPKESLTEAKLWARKTFETIFNSEEAPDHPYSIWKQRLRVSK